VGYISNSKQLCLERDAFRCRHCGSAQNLFVNQLVKRKGPLAWALSNLITLCGNCSDAARKVAASESSRVGVLLCGGRGSRLFPLTKFNNKHTLSVGLIPMVMYPMKTLMAFGVRRVLVVLDRETAGQITNILGSGLEFGVAVSYAIQEGAGGIGEALYLAKDFVKPGEEVVCVLGDNIFDCESMNTSIDLGDNKACVFVKRVPNPQDYGVAVLDSAGKVKDVIEKPKTYVGDLAVLGLYVYTSEVFDVIERIKPSDRGELKISTVNDYYAKSGSLIYQEVGGYWADCGSSIQRYCEASLYGAKKANVSAEEIDSFRSIIFDSK
jgi:glucose-1-phosphate thymidylyltransferase